MKRTLFYGTLFILAVVGLVVSAAKFGPKSVLAKDLPWDESGFAKLGDATTDIKISKARYRIVDGLDNRKLILVESLGAKITASQQFTVQEPVAMVPYVIHNAGDEVGLATPQKTARVILLDQDGKPMKYATIAVIQYWP